MRNSVVVAGMACAVLLSGCVGMSRSSVVEPLAADVAAQGRIDSVTLARPDSLKVTDEFDALFKARVKAKTDACATGSRPLRLDASVERLDKANVAVTAVIGGANVVRGEARLIDVATGKTLGTYKIGKTIVGGRIGVLEMAQAEEQLSDAFGEELCAQAFAKPATTAATP